MKQKTTFQSVTCISPKCDCFDVLKCHSQVLLLQSEFNLKVQAHILASLCAIQNFILMYNSLPDNLNDTNFNSDSSIDLKNNQPND